MNLSTIGNALLNNSMTLPKRFIASIVPTYGMQQTLYGAPVMMYGTTPAQTTIPLIIKIAAIACIPICLLVVCIIGVVAFVASRKKKSQNASVQPITKPSTK
jgi:hypothetical protein